MAFALLLIRLLLAAVFALASMTKFFDLRGSGAAVAAFGLPDRVASWTGTMLPVAELAVAIALLPAATARYGALGALALLGVFAAAIARSLARGESPDCHCFGRLHSEPIGGRTLARNAALAALAALVAAAGWSDPGPSATAWAGHLSAAALTAGIAIAGLAALAAAALLGVLRQNGRLLLRIDELAARLDAAGVPVVAASESGASAHRGLPIGALAPPFVLEGLGGDAVTLKALIAPGAPVLLLFTDPGCGPCSELLPDVSMWQRSHAGRLTVAVLTRGSAKDNRVKMREHGIERVGLDDRLTVYAAYEAAGTPGAVLVDRGGRIASSVVAGSEAISALVDSATRTAARRLMQVLSAPTPEPRVPPIGTLAPAFELEDLTGEPLALAVPDRDTLVLFWNPGCGFCMQMLDQIHAFEQSPPPQAPRLLLISTGSADDNEAMALRAPIALDTTFVAGAAFGATGTPSAILVDGNGRVSSSLAVGAPQVMALATAGGVRAA